MDDHVTIEKDRIVKETTCKYFKRLIVAFIRNFQDENGEVVIPDEFFDAVPDNVGFLIENTVGQNDGLSTDVRVFSLCNDWIAGKDDCGGTENDMTDPDNVKFFPNPNKTKKTKKNLHLRLLPPLDPDPTTA